MGHYTEFFLNVDVLKSAPSEVIEILEFLAQDRSELSLGTLSKLEKEHEFFSCARWESISMPIVSGVDSFSLVDVSENYYTLVVHSYFKNYDGEIKKFLKFIEPYVNSSSSIYDENDRYYAGFTRYESAFEPESVYLRLS